MARAFARLAEPVDLVCSSPKSHARETAAILARALARRPARVLEQLAPRASPANLLAALSAMVHGEGGIALVGHHRQFKSLLDRLGVKRHELRLHRGSIVRVDVDAMPLPHACIPRFCLASTGKLEDVFVGLRKAS